MRAPAINGCAYTSPSTPRSNRRCSFGLAGAAGTMPAREGEPPYVFQSKPDAAAPRTAAELWVVEAVPLADERAPVACLLEPPQATTATLVAASSAPATRRTFTESMVAQALPVRRRAR